MLTPKVDIANARLTFASGLVANVTASRVSKERIRKLRVFQPHCYMSLDLVERRYELYRVEEAAPGERPRVTSQDVRPPEEEPLRAEILEFLGAAADGKPAVDLATGEDGLAALKLALLVTERMRETAQARP
jgi:predicted dehydrogenase